MSSYIWLSHMLDKDTPLYGGVGSLSIKPEKEIKSGDSCNTTTISMPVHAGTHVDAPRHFIVDGKTIDEFTPEEWIFSYPLVLDIEVGPGEMIDIAKLIAAGLSNDSRVDIILLRTGFERNRGKDSYWQNNPGLNSEIAGFLQKRFPKLRAVGIDFISISSLSHRQEGRKAHKEFLSRDIVLIEDMQLSGIKEAKLNRVIILPIRIMDSDGAPCSAIGEVI